MKTGWPIGALLASVASVLVPGVAWAVLPSEDGGRVTDIGKADGVRKDWEGRGVALQLGWSNEIAHNTRGGYRDATREAGQVVLGAHLDLERLWGWADSQFQITVDKRYGSNVGDAAGLGTLMSVHEIHGRGQTWWLTNFYLDKQWQQGRVALRVGKTPVGSDFGFDRCEFLNLTGCGSAPGNLEGGYWHNWPIGPWGARLQVATGAQSHLKLGVYQVNRRYTDDAWAQDNGWKLSNPSGTEGALIPLELGWTPQPKGLPGHHRFGVWLSTAGGDDLRVDGDGLPLALEQGRARHHERTYGAYVSLQQQLTGQADAAGLYGFLNLTQADGRVARVDRQVAAGVVYRQLPWRLADSAGMVAGLTAASEDHARSARQWNALHPGAQREVAGGSEKVVEAFYLWQPQPWLGIRPSVQYIARPGGGRKDDALVLGIKTDVTF